MEENLHDKSTLLKHKVDKFNPPCMYVLIKATGIIVKELVTVKVQGSNVQVTLMKVI